MSEQLIWYISRKNIRNFTVHSLQCEQTKETIIGARIIYNNGKRWYFRFIEDDIKMIKNFLQG